ncbi:uncharacterized protein LOC130636923 [Hydractinia symbiolongicarpus]|uniref:uncharacterized protein LOC130636923 n=1 Tax=Hydractinia symbiolongicarpus TaxID=13093 RepID=UPI00254F8AAA|nr:uncharacterized protein LOC130636923 [Hydractinia symbiolongicarpus]
MSKASHIITEKEAENLGNIYYTPEHLWVGRKAVKLITKESGLSKKKVMHWLSRKLLFLRHIKGPKRIDYPHFTITRPKEMHQFDLLYMPHDRLCGNTYRYILTGIDVASRYKVARPLRTKKASEVADMFKDIYKAGPLHYPKTFQCDNGGEFKSDVGKLLEGKGVEIKRATTKYHHTFTAFVESYNKVLAERLFKPQDAQELVSEEASSTWVKHLYTIVKSLNNTKTTMIDIRPNKAIKLDDVPLAKSEKYPDEKPLPEDGLYLYLLQPGEEYGDSKRRATDAFWNKKTYRLDRIVTGSRVLYYLKDGSERSFVLEELMQVPEDVKVPPQYVKEWYYNFYYLKGSNN